jgi:hypothetical protein
MVRHDHVKGQMLSKIGPGNVADFTRVCQPSGAARGDLDAFSSYFSPETPKKVQKAPASYLFFHSGLLSTIVSGFREPAFLGVFSNHLD